MQHKAVITRNSREEKECKINQSQSKLEKKK
uniref:Uncharacterized protein n=1 Tax=Arundo donax TaxID=35708 RepID=A0A0A8YR48_ARUDO